MGKEAGRKVELLGAEPRTTTQPPVRDKSNGPQSLSSQSHLQMTLPSFVKFVSVDRPITTKLRFRGDVSNIYIVDHFSVAREGESHIKSRLSSFRTSRCVHWMLTSAFSALLPWTRDRSDANLGKRAVSFAACPVCG